MHHHPIPEVYIPVLAEGEGTLEINRLKSRGNWLLAVEHVLLRVCRRKFPQILSMQVILKPTQ